MDYILGVDIGQTHDPASAVLVRREPLGHSHLLHCLYVGQCDLGTKYGDVADWVVKIASHHSLKGEVNVGIDFTGVGRPVVEMVRDKPAFASGIWAVTVTSGRKASREKKALMDWNVPKKDLVGALQICLQERRWKMKPGLPMGAAFKEELLQFAYEVKGVRTFFGGEGKAHDDIVMAASTAAWLADFLPYHGTAEPGHTPSPEILHPGATTVGRPASSWRQRYDGPARTQEPPQP